MEAISSSLMKKVIIKISTPFKKLLYLGYYLTVMKFM